MHDQEIEGAVTSPESGLPLVAGSYPDEVVSAPEVNLGIDA